MLRITLNIAKVTIRKLMIVLTTAFVLSMPLVLRSLVGACWTDARCYELCLDTGRADFIRARDMIVALLENARRGR